jgi:xylan 1,4-beta-xylosidase
VLNVFRMFGKMGGERLTVQSDSDTGVEALLTRGVRGAPDVAALASLDTQQKKLCVMVWHYHDDDVPGPAAKVELAVEGLPVAAGEGQLEHFRIDQDHSNAYTVWQRQGSPQEPSPEMYAEMEEAGQLATLGPAETIRIEDSGATLQFELPRQAVSLLVLQWE